MAIVINMPRLSDTMTEGVVAKWHKQIGDSVNEGDLLAEIETDKATMEFEAFPGQEGKLLYIGTGEGETAPVDTVLAILGEEVIPQFYIRTTITFVHSPSQKYWVLFDLNLV